MDAHTFRRTATYTGPREAIWHCVRSLPSETTHLGGGLICRARTGPVRPVTPTPKPKPANWSQFRLAGAIAALTTLATTRLPDPRDDADLREALALLVGIMRRMKDNRKEAK